MTGRSSPYETIELDGARVRARRRAMRLSQQRLATEAAPVSRGYISIIESQRQASVSQDLAGRLALALKTDISELMVVEGEAGTSSLALVIETPLSTPARKARRISLGAGYPIAPKQRIDLLRDILRRMQEIEQMVTELLHVEEKAE